MQQAFPDDSFLAKWLEGELSEIELQQLKQRDDYEQLKKIVEQASQLELPDYSEEAAWQRLLQAKEKQKEAPKRRLLMPWYGIAAAIALLAISFWFLWPNNGSQYYTKTGETLAIQLPDGSDVILNENSQLELTADWSEKRQMVLKGEAFFKVAKGKPFSVEISNGAVEVLGTSFKVTNKKDNIEVDCYAGKVQVNYKEENAILNPGDQVGTLADGKLEVQRSEQKSEQENFLHFDSVKLKEVFQAMELHFKVKVKLPKETGEAIYTGFFDTQNLGNALKSVCLPMNLKYTISTDRKTITVEKE